MKYSYSSLIKTLSKPLASRLKIAAKKREGLNHFCKFVGEKAHQISSRLNVYASGHQVITIKPLPEEEALQDGISYLSEVFVFAVASTVLVIEYHRSEESNKKKGKERNI